MEGIKTKDLTVIALFSYQTQEIHHMTFLGIDFIEDNISVAHNIISLSLP